MLSATFCVHDHNTHLIQALQRSAVGLLLLGANVRSEAPSHE